MSSEETVAEMLPCSASKQSDTYAPTGRSAELASLHVKQGDCHPDLSPHRPPNLPTTARPAKLMSLRVKQDKNYYVDLVPLRPSPLTRRNLCRSCASSKEIATPILFCTIRRPICLRAATARPAKIDVVAYQARRLPRRPCPAPSAKANLPAATTTRSAKIDVVAYYQARRLPRRPSRTAHQTCPSPPLARL